MLLQALKILGNSHIFYDDEISGARKVLTAAALTYVAAAASSLFYSFCVSFYCLATAGMIKRYDRN